jgi:alkylation response protein AidB-like acyl-CoA dehydrogenase
VAQLAELGAIGALFRKKTAASAAGVSTSRGVRSLGRGLVPSPCWACCWSARPSRRWHARAEGLLEPIIAGQTLAAWPTTKPAATTTHACDHARHARSRRAGAARPKAVVVQAEAADVLLVSARTSGASDDADGISLFLVPANAAGLHRKAATPSTAAA